MSDPTTTTTGGYTDPPRQHTYIVRTAVAVVRDAPASTADVRGYLTKNKRFAGHEVAGTIGGQAACWVARSVEDGGGFVVREVLDEVEL